MTAQKAFTLICDFPIGTNGYGKNATVLRCGDSITIGYEIGPVNSVTDARNWAKDYGWTVIRKQDRCSRHRT